MDKIERYCENELGMEVCDIPAYEILDLIDEYNAGEWDYP